MQPELFFSLLLTHSSQPAVLQITEKVPALCSPHPRSLASVTLPVTQRNSESCSNKETIELMHTHTCARTHAQTVQACHPQWSFRLPPGHVDICTCRKLYRNTEITHMHSCHVALKACYESRLFTHPSIPACLPVRLHWSVQTTRQDVYGFAMARPVFFAFSSRSQRRNWLCREKNSYFPHPCDSLRSD